MNKVSKTLLAVILCQCFDIQSGHAHEADSTDKAQENGRRGTVRAREEGDEDPNPRSSSKHKTDIFSRIPDNPRAVLLSTLSVQDQRKIMSASYKNCAKLLHARNTNPANVRDRIRLSQGEGIDTKVRDFVIKLGQSGDIQVTVAIHPSDLDDLLDDKELCAHVNGICFNHVEAEEGVSVDDVLMNAVSAFVMHAKNDTFNKLEKLIFDDFTQLPAEALRMLSYDLDESAFPKLKQLATGYWLTNMYSGGGKPFYECANAMLKRAPNLHGVYLYFKGNALPSNATPDSKLRQVELRSRSHSAALAGDIETLSASLNAMHADEKKEFLSKDFSIGNAGRCIFAGVLANDDAPMLKLLIRLGADKDKLPFLGVQTLNYAMSTHSFQCFNALLEEGAMTTVIPGRSNSPLARANSWQSARYLKILLKHGANPNVDLDMPEVLYSLGDRPLHLSAFLCWSKHPLDLEARTIDRYLRQTTLVPNENVYTQVLSLLISSRYFEIDGIKDECADAVTDLVTAGANVNAIDIDGAPLLHRVVADEKFSAVKALLDAGADVSIGDATGRSAVTLAIQAFGANHPITTLLYAKHPTILGNFRQPDAEVAESPVKYGPHDPVPAPNHTVQPDFLVSSKD